MYCLLTHTHTLRSCFFVVLSNRVRGGCELNSTCSSSSGGGGLKIQVISFADALFLLSDALLQHPFTHSPERLSDMFVSSVTRLTGSE